MKIRVTISGRHYDRADALPSELSLPQDCSLDEALRRLAEMLGESNRLAGTCLVAVSGKHLGTLASHRPCTLCDGDELLVLAPVAGG